MNLVPKHRQTWIVLVGLSLVAGCAEGPLWRLGAVNPYVRQQWQEEEELVSSRYSHVARLRSLSDELPSMNEEQRQRLSAELAAQFQDTADSMVRREIVFTLAEVPTAAASEVLRKAQSDPSEDVRIAACRAWRRRGGPEAIHALAEMLGGDTDIDVRLRATEALADFQDPVAVQALGVALDDKDPALQYRAMQSLKSASGRDFGNNSVAWREYLQGGNPPDQPESLVQRLYEWF
jgi:hypothetical protein